MGMPITDHLVKFDFYQFPRCTQSAEGVETALSLLDRCVPLATILDEFPGLGLRDLQACVAFLSPQTFGTVN